MRISKITRSGAALAVAAALTMTGCSTKATNDDSASTGAAGSPGSAGGVKTDVGVSASEITLGSLTDTSGVFKILGLGITQGNQMWADEVNTAGGICGRKIKIESSDTGYSVEKAIPLYAKMKPDVLGFVQLLGSPLLAALKKPITEDKIAAIPASWASSNLDVPNVVMVGPTYDVEIINALSNLQSTGKVKDGDTIGHIYIDSEYGKNGAVGSKYYTGKHKMKLVEAKVTSTETDLTAAVTSMKASGVKAILLTTAPAQAASALGVAKAQGLNVPFYGSAPTFAPQLLDTPVADVLMSGQYTTSSVQIPVSGTAPKVKEITAAFKKAHPDQTETHGPNLGYASGLVWGAILKQACSDGDLTRDGILKAVRKTTVDTQGLTPPLDFTRPGEPSTRAMFLLQPARVPGGLKLVSPTPLASAEAAAYKTPFQK